MQMNGSFFRLAARVASIALLAGSAAVLHGCDAEGGMMMSTDSFTYKSTSWQPKTVTLIDTRTGEAVWSVDIPVGKQLYVGFVQGTGPNEYKPDEIVWQINWSGRYIATNKSRLPCPPSTARRLELTFRAAPEMPNAELPGSPFDTEAKGGPTMANPGAPMPKQGGADSMPPPAPGAAGTPTTIKAPAGQPVVQPVVQVEAPKPAKPAAATPPPPAEPAPAPAQPSEPPIDIPKN